MLKQSGTNSGPQPVGAARKNRPEATVAAQAKPEAVATSTATVGATITIQGDVTGKGDVFISGTIEGTINLARNRVTVEGAGRVRGSIVGKQVRVEGKVVGDIEAMEKLAISSTGAVQGTIIAPRVEVEDGAKIKGRIDMEFDEGRDAPAAAVLAKK